MAKVYSWAINNRTYAYIVSPTNTNEAYVGTELKGNNLKIVSDWAQNATDAQYDTQFAKMVALCTSKGYNVSFESALSYRTVETTCDNLRGPAGRGIQSVKFDRTDETLSWYKMIYDDGTEDEFFVKNGTNGKDGADGKDGAQGDTGISSKLIMVYTSGRNANGELITPDRPEGGSFNFNTFETTYPDGWAPSDKALTPPVWMSSRTFTSSALSTDKEWSYPTQITGENGSPGADGTNTEFIFKLTSIKPTESEVSELYSDPDKSGVVPNSNWKASPEGVDEENKTEYYCIRRRNLTTGKWGKWEGAYIWSKYGVNGQDGDGIQYIFMRTKKGTPPINPTPMGYDDPQSEIYANYQNKDTEWVPASGTSYYNYNNEIVNLKGDEYWSDNVQGVDATYQWEWVSVRKYRKNSSNNQHEWKAFDTPALWAKFGEDGKHATSIRRLYCLTPGTDEVPEAPSDNVITGDWGNGFPKGYRKDENVVWAIEAEIWAHNNEFVLSYMVVSATDEKGNILPPIDATTANTKTVESIPAEKYADENIKYLIFNNEYYEWKGGWCEPFLVTGVKGDSGEPVNYTTRYFCAGYNNVLPLIPDTKDKNDFEDRYKYQDVEGNTVYWYRSPDTSRGGVDGSIDDTGKERRWYECLVYINGWDNKIIEYGEIGPLNPRDGEIKDGRYCEFRFGITEEAIVTPYVEQTTPEGLPIRNPKMKPEEGSGWYSSEDDIPAVPVNGALWVIWAYIESDGTMKKDSNGKVWYGPTKISGARGPEGPIGPRGFTGVPGVSMIQRFCLGTYGSKDNNTTGESYFYNGSGYFGSTNWSGTTEDKIVPVGELEGWYTAQSAPYTNIIECSTEDELNTIIANPQNRGRVVKRTYQKSGTTYYDYILIHDTFLGGSEVGYPATANILSGKTKEEVEKLIEDENWGIYLWCIQGSEVWETDEKTGTSKLLGVEWGNPFKMQGSNGIRGIAGNRGQTIYPMGMYNHEEVYITDTNKAPYVYDPNDGLYYIYNDIDTPWVGQLPTGYQNIMKHPSDIYVKGNANFKPVSSDPTTMTSQDTDAKYLCYNDNYYVWQDGKYIMASKYKYSMDGTYGNWIPSQGGTTPSDNYANNTNRNEPPAWVRMESFDALYTNVGIIANGMIGSAVYNNEFMFSQQGVDQSGTGVTNYAEVLNKDDEGFLSAYDYSEAADENGWHWRDKYGNYMDITKINPYEKDDNGYIHKFMPNVCINFATGQIWVSCGKNCFNYDGSGYLADNYINWTDDGTVIIGKPGESDKGIVINSSGITIGPLNEYKLEMNGTISNINQTISGLSKDLQDLTNSVKEDIEDLQEQLNKDLYALQNQVDKKAETYYQSNDPSKQWDDDKSEHVGDMWYDTEHHITYRWNGTKWEEQKIPISVFDMIDGKSAIYVSKPISDKDGDGYLYRVNDMWLLERDFTSTSQLGSTGKQGSIWISKTDRTGTTETDFVWNDWIKKGTELDEWVKNDFPGLVSNMVEQPDGIVNTHYGDKDPSYGDEDLSNPWQDTDSAVTSTYAKYHLGDLWFNTTDNKSYIYTNTTANTTTFKEAKPSGYYWVLSETEIPQDVYDAIDGKCKIFVSEPRTPWNEGDLWLKDATSNTSATDIYRAISNRESGVTTSEEFSTTGKSDWIKACDYTNDDVANQALGRLNAMADDGYVSPEEQKRLLTEKTKITNEADKLITKAQEYDMHVYGTPYYSTYQSFVYGYNYALSALTYYTTSTNAISESADTHYLFIKIVETGTGTSERYYGNIAAYYGFKQDLQNALVSAAVSSGDDLSYLKEIFGNVLDNDGATLTGYLGVKDSNSNIIAYMDGSGIVTDDNGKLVLATGIPVQSGKTLEERAKLAKTKIYDTGLVETKGANLNGTLNSTWAQIGNLKVLGDTLAHYSSDSGNFVVKTGNGSSSADGFGFESIKNGIRYSYSVGDYGPTQQGDTISIGFDDNGNQISNVTYNTSMTFAKGAQFAMVKQGYDFNTFTDGKYFTPTYTALRVICDVGSTSKHSYAIGCPHGMYAGLRPSIEYWTGSQELDIFAHTVVINSSSKVTVNLPANPPNGQEYVLLCLQNNHISINGNGKEIFVMNENATKTSDSFTSDNLRRITLTYCSDYGKWIEIFEQYS